MDFTLYNSLFSDKPFNLIEEDFILEFQYEYPSKVKNHLENNEFIRFAQELSGLEILCLEKDFDMQLLTLETFEKKKLFYEQTLLILDSLIARLSEQYFHEKMAFFKDHLESLANKLRHKYKSYLNGSVINEVQKAANGNKKIVWSAGVASLGKLFYRLIFENKTSNNEAYIPQPVDEVVEFILEHFTDSAGESFTRSSLVKYISQTKTGDQKRAKVKGDIIID